MDITAANLDALDTLVQGTFNRTLADAPTTFGHVAMTINSTTAANFYPKLAEMPGMREWVGSRVINRLSGDGFSIRNETFENTISIGVDDIKDDQYGIYTPYTEEFARTAAELPDNLVWPQLEAGFTETHYDGQFFFDTDHPVEDANGNEVSVSNLQAGSGSPWYLVDDSRPFKAIIFQDREPAVITPKTRMDDDNVFFEDEFIWGVKRRCAAGFGMWQLIQASRQPLTAANYDELKKRMRKMRGHRGRKLNVAPTKLIVGPENEAAAKQLLMQEHNAAGASNIYFNDVELHVENRLTL